MAYDAERIARAALDLLAEVGLDGLTTRRLATELGIEGPALYHHFKNKAELLGEMATAILAEGLKNTVNPGDWKQWLFNHAVKNRQTMLRYRDSGRIIAGCAPTETMKRKILPAIKKPLIDAGFEPIDASEMVTFIAAYTLGFVINEQNRFTRSYVASVVPYPRFVRFRHGVEALLEGVDKKYRDRIRPGRTKSRGTSKAKKFLNRSSL
jgi:TetR/AcrR family tetracycline transcriptional repressor